MRSVKLPDGAILLSSDKVIPSNGCMNINAGHSEIVGLQSFPGL